MAWIIETLQRLSIFERSRLAFIFWMPNQTYREWQDCSHIIYAYAATSTSYRELLSRPVLEFVACEKYSQQAVPHVPIDDQYGVWLPRARLIAGWGRTDDEKSRFRELVNEQFARAAALEERAEKGENPLDRLEYTVTKKCRIMALKTPRLVFAAEDVTRGYGTLVWPVSSA